METCSTGMERSEIIDEAVNVHQADVHDGDQIGKSYQEADRRNYLDLLSRWSKGLERSAETSSDDFPLAGVSTSALAVSLSSILTGMNRWPGERDEVSPGHPVSVTVARTAKKPDYPEPCPQAIEGLSAVEGFVRNGKICEVDGVVVPAGSAQLKVLAFDRWRKLFHPFAKHAKIYNGDIVYDRVMSTDFIQRQLWCFGVVDYLSYLDAIRIKSPKLFVALWLRRWGDVERLTSEIAEDDLAVSFGTDKISSLPVLQDAARESFFAPWAIMSELERIFEILGEMRSQKGITASAVRDRVGNCRSIEELMSDRSGLGRQVQGLLLSSGFIHHTMNWMGQSHADSDFLARLQRSVACSDALQPRFRRVECPDGKPPALFMNGLDAAHFAPVSLRQIGSRVKTGMESGSRPTTFLYQESERAKRETWLSIVILANICPPTAQTLTAKLARKDPVPLEEGERREYQKIVRKEKGWLRIYPTVMALGASAYDTEGACSDAVATFVEDEFSPYAQKIWDLLDRLPDAFKNIHKKIAGSARDSAPQVGKPGWTKGAHFQAWFDPDAELEFLDRCAKPTPNIDIARKYGGKIPSVINTRVVRLNSKSSGRLPFIDPVENVQRLFSPLFTQLQISDGTPYLTIQQGGDRKFAILREAARKFPAWSPINSDPGLAERISAASKRTAGVSAPYRSLPAYQITLRKDWAWQLDWRFSGRI